MLNAKTIILLTAILLSTASFSYGQNRIVQGVIMQNDPNGADSVPANDLPVTIFDPASDLRSSSSTTDIYGRYYFYDVPDGQYQLEIWISGRVDVPNRSTAASVYQISISYAQAIQSGTNLISNVNTIYVSN